MNRKVKPCPFCGCKSVEFQTGTKDREGIPMNTVCTDCGATGPSVYVPNVEIGEVKALGEWNIRFEKTIKELNI